MATVTALPEFTRYYFDDNNDLAIDADFSRDDSLHFRDAVWHVQKVGCIGHSQHVPRNEYHKLCLAVLRKYVKEYGQVFDVVYRGVRSDRPDSEYKILFGSPNQNIAAFYGNVKKYQNVKGILVYSTMKSVLTDDLSELDEEIIFFPDIK